MNEIVNVRLVPTEEETAAERCSEKLVDLVVLLTTKLDNNVEVMVLGVRFFSINRNNSFYNF